MKRITHGMKITGLSLLAVTAGFGQSTPNVLNSQEVAAGYINLFDPNENLSVKWYGITGNNQTSYSFTNTIPASWVTNTENGYKILEVTAAGQNHIATRDSFRNFDLKVEWKVPSQGNSGVFLRFMKIASWGGASGSEVQVVAVDHSDGQQPLHRAGTNYDMFPLRTGQTNWFRPIGEWNEMRIIAYENRVAHYGNGIRLLEYDMNSQAYATAYAASKYRTYPNYKTVHAGSFYLQHHGEAGIKYRSMRAKKFTDSTMNPWAVGSPYRKPNADELIDTLPMDAAMYGPVAIAPGARQAEANVIMSRENGSVLLRFPRQADYTIETRELNGTLASRHQAVAASEFRLSEKSTRMQVLSVSTNGKTVFSHLISPL
jgi:hypothetical protein